jgi:flagellar basal-body rod modification protein FlgD
MMISTLPNLTGTPAAKTASTSTLDQNAFLTLMTTQLKTQDPFDPMDNQAMVAQMAEFSTVSGIAEMNASLKKIVAHFEIASGAAP